MLSHTRRVIFPQVPSAPAPIKAVAAGAHSAVVSWGVPQFVNGRLTHYSIHWRSVASPSGQASVSRVPAETRYLMLEALPGSTIEVSALMTF